MPCRLCGTSLQEGPHGPFCPRCAFARALGAGGSGPGEPDTPLDAYERLHELGRGSMGVVWLARERALDRLVALKQASGSNPNVGARLLREGQAAARLRHPHIVAVYAMGGDGPSAFLAMEFLEGGGLDERLREGPFPFQSAAALIAKLAGALAYAHGVGLLHRDVKPSNVLLDEAEEPHLADFGLAAPLEGGGDLTLPGQVAGTPAYLAPELLQGTERASAASDVYGLGAVLYACLTGRAPFVGESAGAILAQLPVAEPPPPHLLRPGVPRDLETICLKCLEKAPERRYASAALLQADLQAYLEGRPITARPLSRAGRVLRSCRRRPGLSTAIATAAVCLLALAIGGPVMAFRLSRAQASAEDRLREALLARSRATRYAARIGQRDEALVAATEAARIRPGLDARDEAIAALARPEVVVERTWTMHQPSEGLVAYDPDNNQYAVEQNGTVDVRRLSDDGAIRTWAGPPSRLWSGLAFSAAGDAMVSRNAKDQVLVWRAGRTEPAWTLPGRPYAFTGRFRAYGSADAFSPDGRMLASAMNGKDVSLHAVEDGRELRRLVTPVQATHVEFSPDGKLVALGRGILARDGSKTYFLHIHDVASGELVGDLHLDKGFQVIRWSPESDLLLVIGQRLDLYNGRSAVLVRSYNDPQAVRGFFGPRGTTLIGASTGGAITLWDRSAARPLLSGAIGPDSTIAVSRSGEVIVKSQGAERSALFRLEMPGVEHTWPAKPGGEQENVLSAAVPIVDFSPDGRSMAVGLWGYVQLRDGDGRVVDSVKLGTYSNYTSVRFAPDGRFILAGTQESGLLRFPVIQGAGGARHLGSYQVVDPENAFFVTDISRDGSRAIETNFVAGSVKVVPLNGSAAAVRWKLAGAAGAVFLHGDREILANSLESEGGAKVEVRDAGTGAVTHTLAYPHGAHVNVTADGKLVVLGTGSDGTVLLHPADWSRGARLPPTIQGREEQCAISPDGETLAFGAGNRAWLVRTTDGAVLAHLEGAQTGSYAPGLTFSPDGRKLALLWETGLLSVWDLAKLRQELGSRGMDW